jgi:hypothetical protein
MNEPLTITCCCKDERCGMTLTVLPILQYFKLTMTPRKDDPEREPAVEWIQPEKFIRRMERDGWQELGFLTWEDFCVKRLQVRADEVEQEARARIAAIAEKAVPLVIHGGDRKTIQYNNYNVDIPSIQGTSPEYLTARIARDRPDILERMKAGEYKSVRSAAIDAGIVDPEKSKRYSLPADPTAAARYLLTRVDAGWVATFVAELMKAV